MTPAKGYTEMKDSGIEWSPQIPTDWQVKRLKELFSFGKGLPITKADLVDSGVAVISYGQIHAKSNTGTHLAKSLLRYVPKTFLETNPSAILRKGDIVLADTSEDLDGLGNAALMDIDDTVFAGYHTIILHPGNADFSKYLSYLFRTDNWRSQLRANASGIKVFSVTQKMLRSCNLILPPKAVRDAITAYLDTQCAKIDEIIAQAKASIEDYKQWKASIIYEAVTKGLDPNVEMKDSGIEWIGRMPSDWAIIRVKNLLAEINDRSETGSEEPLSMSQVLGIVPSSMIAVANPATSYVGAKIVRPNDLVFNKLKAHLGVFAVSNYDGLVSPDYAVYRANERANPKFLEYLFKTPNCIQEFKKYITGVGAGLSRLYTSDLFSIKVALPVIDVQKHIVEYLNGFCSQADALIDEKQSLIDDLESYKKSLIYEVVTGKRRITEPDQMAIAVLSPDILRYQKALLMLRILDLLGNEARGRIHLQKCMFAAECLLNIPFQTQYIRYDHGPYDLHLADYETVLCDSGWFNIQKGSHVTYQKSRHFAEGLKEYMNVFSDIDEKLKHIVAFLKPMKTTQAERVATLLAAWNDFIIDGISHPTDKEIINEVMSNWTPNKANPQYSTWQDTLTKMRKNRFIPSGFGIHTLKKEVLLQEE